MDIKPIETVYNGYRFRSRLEARWAVFFDAIEAEWEYEPEGFLLPDGTQYLPDFYLKNVSGRGANNIFVEVKAILTECDLHKIELFSAKHPIIIFGQIPTCSYIKPHLVPGLGIVNGFWQFDFTRDNNEHFFNLVYSECDWYWTEPKATKGGGLTLDYVDDPYEFVDNDLTARAYDMARQARFEHGETPEKRR